MRHWRDLIFRSCSSPDGLTDHRNICLVEFDNATRHCPTLAILKFSEYEWREDLPAPKRLDLFLRFGLELNAMLDLLATAPGLRDADRATLLQTREHWLHIDHSSHHRVTRYRYFADLMQGREEIKEYFDKTSRGVRHHDYEQICSVLLKLQRDCYDARALQDVFPPYNIYDVSLLGTEPKKSTISRDESRLTA